MRAKTSVTEAIVQTIGLVLQFIAAFVHGKYDKRRRCTVQPATVGDSDHLTIIESSVYNMDALALCDVFDLR
jgi:hypothetical protein